MHSRPETTQARQYLVFIFEKPQPFCPVKGQVVKSLVRQPKLLWHMHREFLSVKIFNPATLRNTDCGVFKQLDVCRSVNLNWSNQDIIHVFRLNADRSESVNRTFIFLASQFAALTKAGTPSFIQGR